MIKKTNDRYIFLSSKNCFFSPCVPFRTDRLFHLFFFTNFFVNLLDIIRLKFVIKNYRSIYAQAEIKILERNAGPFSF